jgi:hypothetical protein
MPIYVIEQSVKSALEGGWSMIAEVTGESDDAVDHYLTNTALKAGAYRWCEMGGEAWSYMTLGEDNSVTRHDQDAVR